MCFECKEIVHNLWVGSKKKWSDSFRIAQCKTSNVLSVNEKDIILCNALWGLPCQFINSRTKVHVKRKVKIGKHSLRLNKNRPLSREVCQLALSQRVDFNHLMGFIRLIIKPITSKTQLGGIGVTLGKVLAITVAKRKAKRNSLTNHVNNVEMLVGIQEARVVQRLRGKAKKPLRKIIYNK